MLSFFRHFKLYLTSSTERFSQNFKVVVVDGKDESEYSVKWQDFFRGHVVGEYGAGLLPLCLGCLVSESNLMGCSFGGRGRRGVEELLLFVLLELSLEAETLKQKHRVLSSMSY